MEISPQQQVDIVSIVKKYVELTEYDGYLSGCCPHPDHEDESPSFIVWPESGLWKCFGCGKGGDAAQFLLFIGEVDSYAEGLAIVGPDSDVVLSDAVESIGVAQHHPTAWGVPPVSWGEVLERIQNGAGLSRDSQ